MLDLRRSRESWYGENLIGIFLEEVKLKAQKEKDISCYSIQQQGEDFSFFFGCQMEPEGYNTIVFGRWNHPSIFFFFSRAPPSTTKFSYKRGDSKTSNCCPLHLHLGSTVWRADDVLPFFLPIYLVSFFCPTHYYYYYTYYLLQQLTILEKMLYGFKIVPVLLLLFISFGGNNVFLYMPLSERWCPS
jgi:hypothetical protein